MKCGFRIGWFVGLELFGGCFLTITVVVYTDFFTVLVVLSIILGDCITGSACRALGRDDARTTGVVDRSCRRGVSISRSRLASGFLSVSDTLSGMLGSSVFVASDGNRMITYTYSR